MGSSNLHVSAVNDSYLNIMITLANIRNVRDIFNLIRALLQQIWDSAIYQKSLGFSHLHRISCQWTNSVTNICF